MLKNRLLLGAAIAALGMVPMAASAQGTSVDVTATADWDQEVDVDIYWNVDVDKDLEIFGTIGIDGTVEVGALAEATHKNDQIIDGVSLRFEDYQNLNGDTGDNTAEPTDFASDEAHEATYTNTASMADGALGGASGNIGVNLAAGDYNLQENAAVLASADSAENEDGDPSGAAEAGSFILQNVTGVIVNTNFEIENSVVDNEVNVGSGALNDASGNIGVNAAAGAFNVQKNALVIASVRGGNLAEATAAVMQSLTDSTIVIENETNTVTAGAIGVGATGNIGINLAAGFGNMQVNSLTIANALTPPGAGDADADTDVDADADADADADGDTDL